MFRVLAIAATGYLAYAFGKKSWNLILDNEESILPKNISITRKTYREVTYVKEDPDIPVE